MKRNINDCQHKPLRRKAKKLSKESGIGYMAALDKIAREEGFPNWKNLVLKAVQEPQPTAVPALPKTSLHPGVPYYGVHSRKIIGKRPDAKMSVRQHGKVGKILQKLLSDTMYYKRAKKPIQDIRIMLDTWLGEEYNENELSNVEFNQLYYSNSGRLDQAIPSGRQLESYRRKLRTARSVIDGAYPACKPLNKLHERFDVALRALGKWPASAKPPVFDDGRIMPGTFVRLKHNKKIGLVFHHNLRTQVIEGYSDAGSFLFGRQEVSLLRTQPSIDDFKPIRLCWPYGKMKRADRSEVLFNRDYNPIWEKSASGEVSSIPPGTDVKYQDREFFYDDRTAPYYGNGETTKLCRSVLKDWGIADRDPEILKLLPDALFAGNMNLLSPKGFS